MFLQNAVADALNNTEWAFPLAECFHIGGFAVGDRDHRPGRLSVAEPGVPADQRRANGPLHRTVDLDCPGVYSVFGAALYFSQTFIYIPNTVFPAKMALLVVAIVYNFTIHRKVASSANASPGVSKLVAAVSLLLWVGIVFGGSLSHSCRKGHP